MRHVHLLAESHGVDGKNLWELGLLLKIEQESLKPLMGVSFELDKEKHPDVLAYGNQQGDIALILDFATSRKLPLYASDKRNFPEFDRELELEKTLHSNGKADSKLVAEYHRISRQNLLTRDEFASTEIDTYFGSKESGTIIHICGLSHVRNLKNMLGKKDYKVHVHHVAGKQPVNYIKGDLMNTACDVIAHGVAARDEEDMGTGLAKYTREKWPESFERFKKMRRSLPFNEGNVIIDHENAPAIAYLATQPDLTHAELRYVNSSLHELRSQLEDGHYTSCALPKIGCGYGRLQWEDVKDLIERRLSDSFVRCVVYEKDKR